MNKALVSKVVRVLFLVLIGVAFYLPFVTGHVYSTQLNGFVEFSDNLANAQDFATRLGSTANSTLPLLIVYLVALLAAGAVFFVKETYTRVANLATLAVGLLVNLYVYYSLFIDQSDALKTALAFVHPQLGHTLTQNVGYGFYLGIGLVVLGVVNEFVFEKVVK